MRMHGGGRRDRLRGKMLLRRKPSRPARYRSVDPDLLHGTICRLEQRIERKFPLAGLREVARELVVISDRAVRTSREIRRPRFVLRIPIWILLIALFGLLVFEVMAIGRWGSIESIEEFVQVLEPALGSMFFLAAIVAFLLSLETRWKRTRALAAMHELRAIAHVVDMHQLTKDPTEPNLGEARMGPDDRPLTPEEFVRYLDFCSEMLSMVSKIGVLYVQDFPDSVAVGAVDEVESLTNGLSRRIWQKITLLRSERAPSGGPAATSA